MEEQLSLKSTQVGGICFLDDEGFYHYGDRRYRTPDEIIEKNDLGSEFRFIVVAWKWG